MVVNTEQNIIHKLEEKSKLKPLLIFHDESNVLNACDVVVDMALQGKSTFYSFTCTRYVYKYNS